MRTDIAADKYSGDAASKKRDAHLFSPQLFSRERRSGSYSALPFVLAKTLAGFPFILAMSIVYGVAARTHRLPTHHDPATPRPRLPSSVRCASSLDPTLLILGFTPTYIRRATSSAT